MSASFNTSMVSRLGLADKPLYGLMNAQYLTECFPRFFLSIPCRQTNYKYFDLSAKTIRNVNLIRFIRFTHSHLFYSWPVARCAISGIKINLLSVCKIFHSRSLKMVINWPNFEKSIWQTPNDDQKHFHHLAYSKSRLFNVLL